jgi:uncharacterized protein YsxB (DUF464 family)
MTEIRIYLNQPDSSGRRPIAGIRVEGHSNYDVSGRDIVCAGVSMLMHVLEAGVREQLEIPCLVRQDPAKCSWTIEWGKNDSAECAFLYADVVAGLLSMLAEQYPANVRIVKVDAI